MLALPTREIGSGRDRKSPRGVGSIAGVRRKFGVRAPRKQCRAAHRIWVRTGKERQNVQIGEKRRCGARALAEARHGATDQPGGVQPAAECLGERARSIGTRPGRTPIVSGDPFGSSRRARSRAAHRFIVRVRGRPSRRPTSAVVHRRCPHFSPRGVLALEQLSQRLCGRGDSVTMPARPCHGVPAERERPRATPQSVPRNASECLRAATGIATETSDHSLSRRDGHQAPRAANAGTTAGIVMTNVAAAAAYIRLCWIAA